LAVAGCALIAVVTVLIWPGEKEPEYQGKRLSEWLDVYLPHFQSDLYRGMPELRGSAAAVRQIGTNAIPFLLKWVRYDRPAWRDRLIVAANRIQMPRDRKAAVIGALEDSREHRAELARVGFYILGSEASSAVPALAEVMNRPASPTAACNATYSLSYCGKDALPALIAVFTNRALPSKPRCWAGFSMSQSEGIRTNAGPWVPAVVKCLEEKDIRVSGAAAVVLGYWALEPKAAVPALTESLRDTGLRATAAWALGEFGTQAQSAVPSLLTFTNHPDARVRKMVVDALAKIAPEALQTNGVSGR
jgi:hypothetical protein